MMTENSIRTCRRDLSRYHSSLVVAAGGHVEERGDDGAVLEISGLVSYDGEGLEEIVRGRTFKPPCLIE